MAPRRFLFRSAPLLPVLLAACGAGTPTPEPKPPVPAPPPDAAPVVAPPDAAPVPVRYRLTITSATIDGRTADGKEWDAGERERSLLSSGPLAAWLKAHPELTGAETTLGDPALAPGLADDARRTGAADPMVLVEIGGVVFRSPMIPRSFQPLWQFPLVVTLLPASGDVARVTVVDWDGPTGYDVIGTTIVELDSLLARRVTHLPRFGNVESLTLEVERAPDLAAQRRLSVPGRPAWTDTGIDVTAGQEVIVEASGHVCLSGPNDCAYPEGQVGNLRGTQRGFEQRPHASLIGALGDTRLGLGRDARFVAPASGRLFLGVNDNLHADNTGSFDVRVTIR